MVTLEARTLSYSYPGGYRLGEVSLSLRGGDVLCVLGPNGSGKTTLLNVLSGLYPPEIGELLLDSKVVMERPVLALNEIIYIPFQPPLWTLKTPYIYWQAMGQYYGMTFNQVAARVEELAPQLNMERQLHRKLTTLSLGMTHKMHMIAGFLPPVKVRIFDEPFSGGIDPLGIEVLVKWIGQARKRGEIVIFSSQMTEFAERLANRIMVISDGKVAGYGTATELIAQAGIDAGSDRPLAQAYIVLSESRIGQAAGG